MTPAESGGAGADATPRSPPRWRQAPSPLTVLRYIGWLGAGDAVHPTLRMETAVSSHAVCRVTAPDGRSVVVKQVPHEAAARGRGLANELFVYRLAAWMPQIATLVPQPVFLDECRQVIVLESLSIEAPWLTLNAGQQRMHSGIARQLGCALGQLHRATVDMGMPPSPGAGVLGLGTDPTTAMFERRVEVVRLMKTIVADRDLRAALDAGLAAYVQRCVIHGDVRPQNWIVDNAAVPTRLWLLDWEMAGSGDPSWDLGSLCAQAAVEAVTVDAAATISQTSIWPAMARPAIAQALHGYLGTPGLLDGADGTTWDKLVCFTIARVLHIATECAEQGAALDVYPVGQLMCLSRALARDRHATAAELRTFLPALTRCPEFVQ